jgi:hypothetical protein
VNSQSWCIISAAERSLVVVPDYPTGRAETEKQQTAPQAESWKVGTARAGGWGVKPRTEDTPVSLAGSGAALH